MFFGILAKRLTQILINKKYIDTSVQKGGVPGVPGCIEHNIVISKIIEGAKRNQGYLAVLWLDLTNAYGTVPHKLVDHTLKAYHVPQKVQLLLWNYFGHFKMHFTSGDFTTNWQRLEVRIVIRMYHLCDSVRSGDEPPRQVSGEAQAGSCAVKWSPTGPSQGLYGRLDNHSEVIL